MTRAIPNQCAARRTDSLQCLSAGTHWLVGLPFCSRHFVAIGTAFKGTDVAKALTTPTLSTAVVYYFGHPDTQQVKIGTSMKHLARFKGLQRENPGLKMLAVEPGFRDLEAARHQQFVHLRISSRGRAREWFRKAPELLVHIQQVRNKYGPPEEYSPQ